MSSRFENQKSKVTFEDLEVFISPNGAIGGRSKKHNKEYILSSETADFVQVENGEAFSKSWKKCSKEEYCEIQKKLQYNVDVLKSKEESYDPDWDLSEPFHEEQIEMLDLYFNKDDIIYGLNIEDECYVLKSDGIFYEAECNFVMSDNDKHCKVYEAYERKAFLENKSLEQTHKMLEEMEKERKEKRKRIHYTSLLLCDYSFEKTTNQDLLAIDKEDPNKKFLLSILNENMFIKIDNEDFTSLINSRKWSAISIENAKELIDNQNNRIDEREGKNNSAKLQDPSWWDDPDDYYYSEDTNKISYKIEEVFI